LDFFDQLVIISLHMFISNNFLMDSLNFVLITKL